MTQDECSLEQYMHKMSEVLRCPYTVQAARPARHWWLCPRGLAWFQVLMVWSLVKPPASGGPLSRIGDYLCAARGPGLFLRIRKRTTFPPKSAVTRGPPHPLFHRRMRWAERRLPDAQGLLIVGLRLGVSAHGPGQRRQIVQGGGHIHMLRPQRLPLNGQRLLI